MPPARLRFWLPNWPVLLAAILFLAAAAANLALILRATHGDQLFILDDAYIHAAIAKNLLLRHLYAPSPGPFATASSSILWPYLLALVFAVFGMHMWLLLAMNLLLGLAVLWLCHRIWRAWAPDGTAAYELLALLAAALAEELQVSPLRRPMKRSCSGRNDDPFSWLYVDTAWVGLPPSVGKYADFSPGMACMAKEICG
ncbi:hypothetical protein [Silvibacterium dinghuense]|uniref:Uncharacterized protein n=1 Tax=Silvibacterium dinghuense TaxID=1560006 RepID=A0A4Q1SA00_9BACT|nr:hypothetical protein [Silvibacterium dinghuense]RXS93893.1 hypothetical protein ESZ00_17810 [Silvibacterium dinghuense]GGH08537.1 hypothetical protein GCM10011586_26150 [Silvibacterium dinghuense]